MSNDERGRRWLLVTKPPTAEDDAFAAELRGLARSDHWKRFAVSGRMMAELARELADGRPMPRSPSGIDVHPAEDRRAWQWGYDWKPGGPPPAERPEGACAECWRLGEPCTVHYDGRIIGFPMGAD